MVTKGEIAHFEQFLLLSPCFQNAVSYRGIRITKHLYEVKRVKFIKLSVNPLSTKVIIPFRHTTNLQQMTTSKIFGNLSIIIV